MIAARPVRAWAAPAILAVVVALAALPFLEGRYPFLLDFAVGPNWDPLSPRLYGFEPPVNGAWLPLFGALAVLPPDWAASVLVPGVLVLGAVSGYVALPGQRWARLYGAVLLVVNPFVYARILAGQWAVVWGVAALPLALAGFVGYLEEPGPRRLVAAVGGITLLAVSAHVLYASAVLFGLVALARTVDVRDVSALRRAATVAVISLPVNAFWLLPALLDGRQLAQLTAADLVAFTPLAESSPPLFATASMHGFWRGGFTDARDLVPGVELLFLVVLFVAVYGAVSRWDGERGYVVRALVLTGAVAVLLGTGLRGPAAPAFAWLAEHVPLFAGMRDANKFVALLVLAYAYLGALGIAAIRADLADAARSRLDGESLPRPQFLADRLDGRLADTLGGRRLVPALVVGLLVLAPVLYTFPMVTGYAGQATVGDYPAEWDEVEAAVGDDGDGAVLVLPWHGYVDLSWLDSRDPRVLQPARHFFSAPVIQGDTVELGPIYSRSTNPVSEYVESVFGLGPGRDGEPVEDLGAHLAHANVEHVALTTEADWRGYDAVLREAEGLSLVRENEHVRLYRVEPSIPRAYGFDGPAAAPAGGPPDPADRDPLALTKQSPVEQAVAGTDRDHLAVARTQVAAGPGWEYGGDPPVDRRGARPIFAAAETGAELRYAPFHSLYVPSYALSVLAVVLLGGYWFLARTDHLPRTWNSTTPSARTPRND